MDRIEVLQRQKEAQQLWAAGRREEAFRLLDMLCSAFPRERGLIRLRVRWLVALRRYDEALPHCQFLTKELKDPEGPVLTTHIEKLRDKAAGGGRTQSLVGSSKTFFGGLTLAVVVGIILLFAAAWGIHYVTRHAVTFPSGPSVGQIFVRKSVGDDWQLLGEAHGRVVLPANRRFRLVLNATGNTPLDLGFLDSFSVGELSEIEGVGTWIGDGGVSHIARHTGLEFLGLRRTGITNEVVDDFGVLTALHHLDLSENDITDTGFSTLSALPALETLWLPSGVTDTTLSKVAQWPNIQTLECARTGISGKGIAALAESKSLRSLNLSVTNIGDADLSTLRRLSSLERLDLSRTRISDRGLQVLKGWRSLKTLNVAGSDLSDAGLAVLAELPALERLDASVHAGRPRLSERGTVSLSKFPALLELRLSGAAFSAKAITKLRATLPSCQVEWEPVSVSQVRFPAHRSLGTLWIRPAASTSELDWVRHASAQGAVEIPDNMALRLDVYAQTPPDTLLCGLADLAAKAVPLQALRLPEGMNVDASLWGQLRAFPGLEELRCSGAIFSDWESGSTVVLARLKTLDLSKTTPPATMLVSLGKLSALQRLNLSGATVVPGELEGLRQALSACQITEPIPATRTLDFPTDGSLGTLWMRAAGEADTEPWIRLGAAQGAVSAPVDAFVRLDAVPGVVPSLSALQGAKVSLDALALPGCSLQDNDLQSIAGITSLQSVDLSGTSLSVDGLKALASMPKLRRLVLSHAALSQGAVQSLSAARGLEELDLSGTGIQEAELTAFREFSALKTLYLNGCPISNEAVAPIRATLPDCRIVTALPSPPPVDIWPARVIRVGSTRSMGLLSMRDGTASPESPWESIGSLCGEVPVPAEKVLRLQIPMDATYDLSPLTSLPPDALHTVSLAPGSTLNVAGGKALSGLRGLRVLILEEVEVRPGALDALVSLTQLQRCSLFGAHLRDDELGFIRSLGWLAELDLGGTTLSNDALVHVAALPELRRLDLHHNRAFTDTGLMYLSGIGHLREMDASFTGVTDAALGPLQKLGEMERIDLLGTLTSDALVTQLSQAIPGVQVNRDRIHFDESELALLSEKIKAQARSKEGLTRPRLAELTDIPTLANATPEDRRRVAKMVLSAMANSDTGITQDALAMAAGVDNLRDAPPETVKEIRKLALSAMADSETGLTLDRAATVAGVERIEDLPEGERQQFRELVLSAMAESERGVTPTGLATAAGAESIGAVPEAELGKVRVLALSAMAQSETGITTKSIAATFGVEKLEDVPVAERESLRDAVLSNMAKSEIPITPKALTGWEGSDTLEGLPAEQLNRVETAALSAMAESGTGITSAKVAALAGAERYAEVDGNHLKTLKKSALSAMADSATGMSTAKMAEIGGVASLSDLSPEGRTELREMTLSAMADSEGGLKPTSIAMVAGVEKFEDIAQRDLPELQKLALSAMAESDSGITAKGVRAITNTERLDELPANVQERLRTDALSAMADSDIGMTANGLAAAAGVETFQEIPNEVLPELQTQALSILASQGSGVTTASIAAVNGVRRFDEVTPVKVEQLRDSVFSSLVRTRTSITPKALTGWEGVDEYAQIPPERLQRVEHAALSMIVQAGTTISAEVLSQLGGAQQASEIAPQRLEQLREEAFSALGQSSAAVSPVAIAQMGGTKASVDLPESERYALELAALTAFAKTDTGITDESLSRIAGVSAYSTLDDATRLRLRTMVLTALARADLPLSPGRVQTALAGAAIEEAALGDTDITDEELAFLPSLRSIRTVDLSRCSRLTDGALAYLQNVPLRRLVLSGTPITDAGLTQLRGLSSLRELDLSSTGITDSGLTILATLPLLTTLNLEGTAVSDEGLFQLSRLTALETLGTLNCPNITEPGRVRFAAMASRAKISAKTRSETIQSLPRGDWFGRFAFASLAFSTNLIVLYISFLPLLIRVSAGQRMVAAVDFGWRWTAVRTREYFYFVRWWILAAVVLLMAFLFFRTLTFGYDELMRSIGVG